jgi:transposase
MIYLGVDHHKKDAQVMGIDEMGTIVVERRLPCKREDWEQLRSEIAGPIQTVLEAGWNWGKLFDLIEELGFNPRLANPLKVRLIAESFIKTDRRDALALAQLLRMNWIPEVHVPPRQTRDQRNLLRQRAWLVQQQTRIKNRIHAILDRNHVVSPQLSDVFGRGGKTWMRNLQLRDPDGLLLAAHLDLLDRVQTQIRETEGWIDGALKEHADWQISMSLPGVGKLLGALIVLEIDGLGRFASPEKLCSYSGLVTSVYKSGETEIHGGLVPGCNRHLRYAFVEAAWTAIRVSPYFAEFYRRLKAKKGSQVAIGAVARKLCVIMFHCLRTRRHYVERPYRFRPGRPVNLLA